MEAKKSNADEFQIVTPAEYRDLVGIYPNLNPTQASELAMLASALGRDNPQVALDSAIVRKVNELAIVADGLTDAENWTDAALEETRLMNEAFQVAKQLLRDAEAAYQASASRWLATSHAVTKAEGARRELRGIKLKCDLFN